MGQTHQGLMALKRMKVCLMPFPASSPKHVRNQSGQSILNQRSSSVWLYKQTSRSIAAILCMLMSMPTHASTTHRCANEAKTQAKKLLAFHFGSEERIELEDSVKTLPAIRNPAKPKQSFDVLEVWGHIYKGQYRMRLIYARLPGECVLMGQEILEHAAL